ncbi:MAG: hypothetical protein PUK14_02045 [Clostridiales bacterium]|nr:hypothetical protein [Clostridiales bacterium]MDY6117435.1 hypothetical protein [Anaerovoracaceae bacterium]
MAKKKVYYVKPLTEGKKNINYHKFISAYRTKRVGKNRCED